MKEILTIKDVIKTLDETTLSNEYDRLKLFYQLTSDVYIDQNDFCKILEDYFGLIIGAKKSLYLVTKEKLENVKHELEIKSIEKDKAVRELSSNFPTAKQVTERMTPFRKDIFRLEEEQERLKKELMNLLKIILT